MSMTAESVCDTTARPRAWLRPGLLFSVFAILPVAPPSAAIGIDIDQAADAPPEAVTPAVTPGRTLQPLEPGRRWTYTYVRERTRGEPGGKPEVESFRGTLVDQIVGVASSFGPDAVELRSTLRGQAETTRGEAETESKPVVLERRTSLETADGGHGYRVLGIEAEDPLSGRQRSRFEPPLRQLIGEREVGKRWLVGEVDIGGLRTRIEGEVLGTQDAKTPAGVYERCLVVRYSGKLSGRVDAFGSSIEVRDGSVVATEWYAPGVGVVLAKEETRQTLVLADDTIVEFSERTQYALREAEYSLPAARAPGDPPAATGAAAPEAPAAPEGSSR